MAQDRDAWMWERARSIVDRADRIQRSFFHLSGSTGARPTWEPPVDVFQSDRELWILVALPGVCDKDIEVGVEGGELVVRGQRSLPNALRRAHVHRLEIPYGRFERRVALPKGRYEATSRQFLDGCLALCFRILP